ncbi:hypothetical protein B0T21DRAFT_346275 [Apiosordaria backusii]|uniref:Uncharacterized protein n=1 Tax=Apiosordaria backusii TaxID=314023 RepID=A0AA40K1F4_9PEZI|nr:hypothetical protein B0T21DRAFT_346275 [Apiosordaria backusii]
MSTYISPAQPPTPSRYGGGSRKAPHFIIAKDSELSKIGLKLLPHACGCVELEVDSQAKYAQFFTVRLDPLYIDLPYCKWLSVSRIMIYSFVQDQPRSNLSPRNCGSPQGVIQITLTSTFWLLVMNGWAEAFRLLVAAGESTEINGGLRSGKWKTETWIVMNHLSLGSLSHALVRNWPVGREPGKALFAAVRYPVSFPKQSARLIAVLVRCEKFGHQRKCGELKFPDPFEILFGQRVGTGLGVHGRGSAVPYIFPLSL